jgi:hypothetical protein
MLNPKVLEGIASGFSRLDQVSVAIIYTFIVLFVVLLAWYFSDPEIAGSVVEGQLRVRSATLANVSFPQHDGRQGVASRR